MFNQKEYTKKYYSRPDIKSKKKVYLKIYYQDNKEKFKDHNKEYYQENKVKACEHMKEYFQRPDIKIRISKQKKEYHNKPEIKKKMKKYREDNRDRINEYSSKWYKENSLEVKAYRKEYLQHPEVKAYRREYYKKKREINPNFALTCRLRALLRQAFKSHKTRKQYTSKKYGIDWSTIIEHLKPFPKDIENYNIHHIKPLFTFDFNNPAEIKKAFAPENHKLLTIKEHRKINHWNLK